jgi:hypothetical protein
VYQVIQDTGIPGTYMPGTATATNTRYSYKHTLQLETHDTNTDYLVLTQAATHYLVFTATLHGPHVGTSTIHTDTLHTRYTHVTPSTRHTHTFLWWGGGACWKRIRKAALQRKEVRIVDSRQRHA